MDKPIKASSHRFRHWVLCVPLVALPILIGGARPWLWGMGAAVFFVGLAALVWVDPVLFRDRVHGKWLWLLGFLLLYPFFQAAPLPHSLLELFTPQRVDWIQDADKVVGHNIGAADISYEPLPTLMAAFFGIFLAAFAWLFRLTTKEEKRLSWLWNLLFLLAGLEALYGIIQVLIPNVGVLWFPSNSYRGMARGTFINKNHYAAFLGMIWPLLTARVLSLQKAAAAAEGTPARELSSFEKERQKATRQKQLFLSFIVGLTLLAILFSQSRGGVAGALVAMTVFALVGKTRRKGILALIAGLWVVALSYGAIMGFDAVLERFDRMEQDAPGRFQVWKDTLEIVREHPWSGTGLGTYPKMIRIYQTSLPANLQYGHAHGDYLELASELGLPAAALMLLLVWGYWIASAKRVLSFKFYVLSGEVGDGRAEYERRRLIAVGALAGSAAFLCHSIVEFNWQIPANQIYFILLLVLMKGGKRQS